jgi:radical SAM superfamily enzyme YgiQ (UPF0313 family)
MKRVALLSPLEESPPLEGFSRIMNLPRYGTTTVPTAIRNAGYDIRVFSEFVRCKIDWEYVFNADYVCFSLMSYCSARGYEMADMIRSRSSAPIIFGGSHASMLPEDCLAHGDYAVRNEGEETVVELLRALDEGKATEGITGISYLDSSGNVVHNPDRPFMKDIDLVPDITLLEGYRPYSWLDTVKNYIRHRRIWVPAQILQTTRGCPHKCVFCFGRIELGNRYRMRSIDSVIVDMKNKLSTLRSPWFYIVDNEFTVNRKRTRELLNRIIGEFGNKLQLLVFARVELGRDEELLRLMKRAGVYRIYLGIESINNESLDLYDKKQKLDDIVQCMKAIYAHGMGVFASMVLGADEDTRDTIRDTFSFLIDHRVGAVCALTLYDFPGREKLHGTPQAIPDNRFIHNDWRFYNGNFVIFYPKRMRPSTLQQELIYGLYRFYSVRRRYGALFLKGSADYLAQFYSMKPVIRTMERYVEVLKRYETGLYDSNEQLIEKKLPRTFDPGLKRFIPI